MAASSLPKKQADIKAVPPSIPRPSGSAPFSSKNATISPLSAIAARWSKGVPLPSLLFGSAPLRSNFPTPSRSPPSTAADKPPPTGVASSRRSFFTCSPHTHRPVIDGKITITPKTSGTPIRRSRCFTKPSIPRLRHIIAVKNPLTKKKSGIRNPWIQSMKGKITSGAVFTSVASQAPIPENESTPCSTSPSNIAPLRSPSKK